MANIIRFETHDELKGRYSEPGIFVRVYKSLGQYPRTLILSPEGFFWADNDLVFSAVKGQRWSSVEDDTQYYSEFDWVTPEELRFIASINLCEISENAHLRLYPFWHWSQRIAPIDVDLEDPETAQSIKQLLIDLSQEKAEPPPYNPKFMFNAKERHCVCNPSNFNLKARSKIFNAISINDRVLMRGLSTLIKAEMLACYQEFYEEATIILFITLEASLELILNKLRSSGVEKPSAHDAGVWVHEHFGTSASFYDDVPGRYFGDVYDQRIMTIHPNSRFGKALFAPLMYDDFIDLRRWLKKIFYYLITGTHEPGHMKIIEYLKKKKT